MAKGLITSKLFQAILAARRRATALDPRKVAPSMTHLPDCEAEGRLNQARRRKEKR
ncbi:MAG: hypothetical protein ACK4SZ_16240 [Allosphingosinicella sp.]|uniref:hypothetical protein n=1 Tax=Allosphingosinicella sp. TaxID=2823234 RepID=UPI003930861F